MTERAGLGTSRSGDSEKSFDINAREAPGRQNFLSFLFRRVRADTRPPLTRGWRRWRPGPAGTPGRLGPRSACRSAPRPRSAPRSGADGRKVGGDPAPQPRAPRGLPVPAGCELLTHGPARSRRTPSPPHARLQDPALSAHWSPRRPAPPRPRPTPGTAPAPLKLRLVGPTLHEGQGPPPGPRGPLGVVVCFPFPRLWDRKIGSLPSSRAEAGHPGISAALCSTGTARVLGKSSLLISRLLGAQWGKQSASDFGLNWVWGISQLPAQH